MRLRDEEMLERYAQSMAQGHFSQVNHLTQLLYLFGKFKWRSRNGDHYL